MRHLIVTDSDIIESIGFDNNTYKGIQFGAMEVVFKSTPEIVYRYENVPIAAFALVITAPSIGKAFHERFRKTKFPFTKSERQKPMLKK